MDKKLKANIFIIVESELRWLFFSRMYNALLELGYRPIYITICPLAYKRGKKQGYDIYLVKNVPSNHQLSGKIESLEYKLGEIDKNNNDKIIINFMENFKKLSDVYHPEYIFIYNGTTIFPLSAAEYAKKNGIKTLFYELANIPNKMFVDAEGTNAYSKLYREPSILDIFDVSDDEYVAWYNDYKKRKRVVKQANFGKSSLSDFLDYAIDKLFFCIYIDGVFSKASFIYAYLRKIIYKYGYSSKNTKNYSEEKLKTEKYILLPLQVTKDSQVLFHSDIRISESINFAKQRAVSKNCKLYIKPHPAEMDNRVISVLEDNESDNVVIVYGDIIPLIENAEEIIVINSTAGLEAIMAGKEKIIFLGRSYYKYFKTSPQRLKKYIMEYLVEIDYFSQKPIPKEIIIKCLKR